VNLISLTIVSAIDVIIAVKDRSEIAKCIQSLLQVQAVARIIVCDGGSSDQDMTEVLQALGQYEKICILRFPDSGFNKARLLNQGILQATSNITVVDLGLRPFAVVMISSHCLMHPAPVRPVQNELE
jgi:glycosyltransferase involved in cell wall biosynthesis